MVETNHREDQRLALQGGMKAVSSIEGKGEPKIGPEEFMAVARRFGFSESALEQIEDIIRGEDLGAGPFLANYYSGLEETCVEKFEKTAREVFGTDYALGVNSGTSALHAAFVAVGAGPGTEVICPAIGFMATAMAVVAAGAIPVFCDVDESLSIDPQKIEDCITPRTVAIAPTAVIGSVCDMESVMAVAEEHDLKVVEDCAQSCGAEFHGKAIGTFGDAGCFSISAYKIVGGGEGGLMITNDKEVWQRANQLAEGGGLWRPERFAVPRYQRELFPGLNYRMSELEAAIDAVQLTKLSDAVNRFRTVKRRILKDLKSFREITPQKLNDPDGEVGYVLRFYPETHELGAKIVEALNAEGIGCGMRGPEAGPDWHQYSHMFPITLKKGPTEVNCPFECPIYKERGGEVNYDRGECPVADDLFDRMVSVSLNQWYTEEDCQNIAAGINKVFAAYGTPDDSAPGWIS